MKKLTHQTSVRLARDVDEHVRKTAERLGCSKSEVLRSLLTPYLETLGVGELTRAVQAARESAATGELPAQPSRPAALPFAQRTRMINATFTRTDGEQTTAALLLREGRTEELLSDLALIAIDHQALNEVLSETARGLIREEISAEESARVRASVRAARERLDRLAR